jgi:SanA protein
MKKKLFYITLIIAILCVISIFICDWTIKKNAASCIYTEISDIPANNVGLLLGTSPKLKSGNNNLYFDYRIDAAVTRQAKLIIFLSVEIIAKKITTNRKK